MCSLHRRLRCPAVFFVVGGLTIIQGALTGMLLAQPVEKDFVQDPPKEKWEVVRSLESDARELLLHGQFDGARQKFEHAVRYAITEFGKNHWRARQLQHQLAQAQRYCNWSQEQQVDFKRIMELASQVDERVRVGLAYGPQTTAWTYALLRGADELGLQRTREMVLLLDFASTLEEDLNRRVMFARTINALVKELDGVDSDTYILTLINLGAALAHSPQWQYAQLVLLQAYAKAAEHWMKYSNNPESAKLIALSGYSLATWFRDIGHDEALHDVCVDTLSRLISLSETTTDDQLEVRWYMGRIRVMDLINSGELVASRDVLSKLFESLKMAQQTGKTGRVMAGKYLGLAYEFSAVGDKDRAHECAIRSQLCLSSIADEEYVMSFLGLQGQLAICGGHLRAAETMLTAALEKCNTLYGSTHPFALDWSESLLRAKEALGRMEEAEALRIRVKIMRESLDRFKASWGKFKSGNFTFVPD